MQRNRMIVSLLLCAALLLAACGGGTAPSQNGGSVSSSASTGTTQSRPQAAASASTGSASANTQQNGPQPRASAASASGAGASANSAGASTTGAGAAPRTDQAASEASQPPVLRDRPGPSTSTDLPYDSTYYQNYGVNPFVAPSDDPLSTFAMDIDTAAYGVMRRYLSDGYLPDPDSVRVEEYLNSFDYRYAQPDPGSNFAIALEGAPSPFGGPAYEMVQIGIQGRTIAAQDRLPTSLTFVIDVSGSMDREDRLATVKRALALLVEQLRPDDQVGIVVYGDTAQSILLPTNGNDKGRILDAIDALQPAGSTNVEAGLDVGFAQAADQFLPNGSNMILLLSDGVANNGVTDPQALLAKYERYTAQRIKLSTFGFGMGNYNDVLMEQLADAGNGFYTYIDTLEEAQQVFVQNLTGTLQLIARDAKIQVEFNPEVVSRYRLVGYENRDVADQDFRNDTVDAGEVGAGHSVTALYEIKRYPGAEGDLATVRIRYHKPNNTAVVEEQAVLRAGDVIANIDDASPQFRLAVSVATYAELLRHSRWTQGTVLTTVLNLANGVQRDMRDAADVREFVGLLDQAARLAPSE